MDVREKLVELLADLDCNSEYCKDCEFVNNIDGCVRRQKEIIADRLIANGVTVQDNTEISGELLKRLRNAPITVMTEEPSVEVANEWISVNDRLPENFVSVLGYMTDAGEFPSVRECYTVGNAFFFPALGDIHPVSHWCEMPQPQKEDA